MKKRILPLLLFSAVALVTPALAQTTPSAPVATPADNLLLGRVYQIETQEGTRFTGTLVSLSLTSAEFDSKEVGHITVERTKIRRADLQGPVQAGAKSGYYDIGNGTRLFNAPTGRSLRQGEGTLLTTYLFLVGGEYGITNNLSIGATISLIPGIPLSEQLFVLSPKFSAPINDKLHAGVGIIYANVPFDGSNSGGAGIGYASLTYGSADNNLTLGLGYGFTSGEIGRTPVFQLGGQKRISRRISLISENYIVADSQAGMGGLYGLKFNWRRTSLGVAAAYAYIYAHDENSYTGYFDPNTGMFVTQTTKQHVKGEFGTSYILPVYVDFAFRFGKK